MRKDMFQQVLEELKSSSADVEGLSNQLCNCHFS